MAFSLVDKIYTNYVPTHEEVSATSGLLAGAMEKRRCLDTEISQLRAMLDDLTSRKERLSRDLEAHRCMLSPARRLLPEILQEIFYHCLPTAHNSVISSREAPLMLGRVCSRWRQIAFSTARLWTSIHIVTPSQLESPRTSEKLRRKAISAWLHRSGALPLSISIISSPDWPETPATTVNTVLQPYLDLISPFAPRWKSVHFEFHEFDWTILFNRYTASDLPCLETFHVQGNQPISPLLHVVPFDLTAPARENGILLAPRLRVLSLPGYQSHILQFRIRWNNLIGLDLSRFNESYEDVPRALKLCPNLEFCSIYVSDRGRAPDCSAQTDMKITLPRLHTLRIKDGSMTSGNAVHLVANLVTPTLYHLTYERFIRRLAQPEDELPIFQRLVISLSLLLSRLISPLRELDLPANSLSGKGVIRILSLVPGLKRLSIRSYGNPDPNPYYSPSPPLPFPRFLFNDWPLMMLTPQTIPHVNNEVDELLDTDSDDIISLAPGSCLCPELEVFHCTGAMFSSAKMTEFLHSRSINHQIFRTAHLRRVSISFVPGRKRLETAMARVRTLEKETGMVINVYHTPLFDDFPPRATRYSPYDGLEPSHDLLWNETKPPQYFVF